MIALAGAISLFMMHHFCPTCGSTVYWEGEGFPAPTIGVWEESRHPWLSLPTDTPPKRMAKQG